MISCKKANEGNLVDDLEKLDLQLARITPNVHLYLSSLDGKDHASFKVNSKPDLWFDHDTSKDGNLVNCRRGFIGVL